MIFSAWWKFQIEILWGGKITSFGERERERLWDTDTGTGSSEGNETTKRERAVSSSHERCIGM
jgi:hypothetical protein